MSLLLRYVDPSDLTTVLLDLNSAGLTWSGNGLAVMRDPKFGSRVRNVGMLKQPGVAGQVLASLDDDISAMVFTVGIPPQANMDAIRALAQALATQVGAGGVIAYQPDGASQIIYIDAFPASSPALLNGQTDGYFKVAGQLTAPDGLDLSIPIQPYARLAPLSADVNKLVNSGLLEDFNNDGTPDLWAWDDTTGITGQKVDDSQRAFTFNAATGAAKNLRQVYVGAAAGDIWTASFYAWSDNVAKAQVAVVIEYLSAANALLATYTGSLVASGPSSAGAVRASVTTAAAPATTAKARVSLRVQDVDATACNHWWSKAQLEKAASVSSFRVGAETLSNLIVSSTPFAKHIWLFNAGNAPALVQLSVVPEGGASVIATPAAVRSQGNLAEFSRKVGFRAINASTLGTDCTSQADAAAAGGNALRCTFATNGANMAQLFRNVMTPVDLKAFRGRFKIRAAIRPEVLTDKTIAQNIFQAQLRWSKADPGAGRATSSAPTTITLDTTNPTLSDYIVEDLGYVTVDANVTALNVEVWGARSSGTGNLWIDEVWLVPADELVAMPQVPGFLASPGQAPETWSFLQYLLTPDGCKTGAALAASGTAILTNKQYQGFQLPPQGGVVYAAGRHLIDIPNSGLVGCSVQNGDKIARTIGEMRVRKSNTNPAKRAAWTNAHGYGVGDIVWDGAAPKGRTFICTTAGTSGGAIPGAFATATNGQTGIADNTVVWAETVVSAVPLTAVAGQLYSLLGAPVQPEVAFDYSGSIPFETVFVQTVLGNGEGGVTFVRSIFVAGITEHAFVRTVGDNTTEMVSDNNPDPMLREAFLRAAGSYFDRLVQAGPFIEIPPDWSLLEVEVWEVADPGYESVDARFPLARHVAARNFTVKAATLIPRVTPAGA